MSAYSWRPPLPYDLLYFVIDPDRGGPWSPPTTDPRLAKTMADATGCVVVGVAVAYQYDGRKP